MDTAEDGPGPSDQDQEGAVGDAVAEGEPMTAAEFLLHMQRSGNTNQQEVQTIFCSCRGPVDMAAIFTAKIPPLHNFQTHAIEALRAHSAYAAYNEESSVKGAERCRIEEVGFQQHDVLVVPVHERAQLPLLSTHTFPHTNPPYQITLESCQYLDRNGLKSLLDHPIRSFRNVNTVLSRSFFESASYVEPAVRQRCWGCLMRGAVRCERRLLAHRGRR
jgi:hypothetical protein